MTTTAIVVNPLPVLNVNVSTLQLCSGQTLQIDVQGADSYSFSNGVSNGVPFTPSASATYSISGGNASTACNSTVTIVSVTVNPLPILSISGDSSMCVGESLTLNASGANSFTWSSGDNSSSIIISPTAVTTYTVYGTDSNGCENSIQYTQQVNDCTGLPEILMQDAKLKIYPNPNNGRFYISGTGNRELSILNDLGQELRKINLEENEALMISDLPDGIYFVVAGVVKQKLIVTR
jgi:hypothetical protein